eukprot:675829-Pyramimonas_sp.AAC.1
MCIRDSPRWESPLSNTLSTRLAAPGITTRSAYIQFGRLINGNAHDRAPHTDRGSRTRAVRPARDSWRERDVKSAGRNRGEIARMRSPPRECASIRTQEAQVYSHSGPIVQVESLAERPRRRSSRTPSAR